MLTRFPTSKNYNLAGLLSFQFAHTSVISGYPGVFDSKILQPVTFVAGLSWLTGYATDKSLNFIEEAKASPDGIYYEQTISGVLPGDHLLVIQQMSQMDGQDFILLIKDKNQQNRLVGGYGYPLKFSSAYRSGSDLPDQKGYNFSFIGTSPFRAPVYL